MYVDIINEVTQDECFNIHGSQAFEQIRSKVCCSKIKTKEIINELRQCFYQDPIEWENVKEKIWSTDEEQEKNKFAFMQGDIIKTNRILSLGQSRSNVSHKEWVTCSPTCDISRGQYIKVAKLFRIDIQDTVKAKKGTPDHNEFQKLALGAKFSTSKYFPMPPLPLDSPDTYGYYADLVTPYYLEKTDLDFAIPEKSLKLQAWDMLNIFLMQSATRSNSQDEPHIRYLVEGKKLPEALNIK